MREFATHTLGLDSPLNIPGKLPTKDQILGADRDGGLQEQEEQPEGIRQ